MKDGLIILILMSCISCSDNDKFYSTETFNDQFTNGLFISKLTNENIPYQFDYSMGQQYFLVHANFKERVTKLRRDSLTESKSLSLINLDNDCSQQNLSKRFKEANVFHVTLNKRGIPMIRVTNKAHSSESVTEILSAYDWRCN